MIVSFGNKKTRFFYNGMRVAEYSGFARTASRKLDQLDAATPVLTTSVGRAITLRCSEGIEKDNGAFASMISGGFVSSGLKIVQGRPMSKLWTITRIEETCYA